MADVAADVIEPALVQQDWSGAVIAGPVATRPLPAPEQGGGAGIGGALLVLGAVLLETLVWLLLRRRRTAAPKETAEPAGPSREDLANQANALLIELDDLHATEVERLTSVGVAT